MRTQLIIIAMLIFCTTTCSAQTAVRNKHNLGLFQDIAADTLSDGTGRIIVSAPHIRFTRIDNALNEPLLGDTHSAAVVDADGDGDLDLIIGADARHKLPTTLLINDGTGHFSRLPESGLPSYITQVLRGDFNNDGNCDLVVLGNQVHADDATKTSRYDLRPEEDPGPIRNQLIFLFANGDGTFSAVDNTVTDFFNRDDSRQTISNMDLGDIDRDGRLDIAVSFFSDSNNRLATWLNKPDGFQKSHELELPVEQNHRFSYYLLSFFDNDQDSYPDLFFVATAGFWRYSSTVYWCKNTVGKFGDLEKSTIPDDPKSSSPIWTDVDNDLDFDILSTQTNAHGARTKLYLNENDRFDDIGRQAGLWLGYKDGQGFAVGDVDNDGWQDLLPVMWDAECMPVEINLLLNLGDHRFGTVRTVFEPPLFVAAGSVIFCDLDNDMDLDLVVAPMYAYENLVAAESSALLIYRNDSECGNGILFDLHGTRSNRSAIGAHVLVTAGKQKMIKYVGEGTVSARYSTPLNVHFGLGKNTAVDTVQVSWPSGLVEQWYNRETGRKWILSEGSGKTVR